MATVSTAKLPVGTLTIMATYNGEAKSAKSSGTVSQTVKKATTRTRLIFEGFIAL